MGTVESERDAVTARTGKNFAEHRDLHSEQGALRGEHPGRSANPAIKVSGLAWLEFEKVDLNRSERFAVLHIRLSAVARIALITAAQALRHVTLHGWHPLRAALCATGSAGSCPGPVRAARPAGI